MEKKYRLLKDTINCKAGTVFNFSFQGNWCHYTAAGTDGKTVDVDQSYVENNSEWFEIVKEDAFEWTDLLVCLFADWYRMAQQQSQFLGIDLLDHWKINYAPKLQVHNEPKEDAFYPSVEQGGIIAAGMSGALDAKEQSFFIAGFQECLKYLNSFKSPQS